MREFEELQLMSPSELHQVYNDLLIRLESERLTREEKYKIEYLQLHFEEHTEDFYEFLTN
ncbi:MAG: hypothetical protein C0599_02940 [Salinivirgaceae bacterium]|nr:MAG: hypothetical protein C0599_02940 [Salinivirgaceae bacterium]